MSSLILQIALPSPLRRLFDYRAGPGLSADQLLPGMRVRVPFGQRQLVGLIVSSSSTSVVPASKLRSISELIDLSPVLPKSLWLLCIWTAQYYQHSLGDTLSCALPNLLAQGEAALARQDMLWQLLPAAYPEHPALRRAHKQKEAVRILAQHPHGLSHALLSQWGLARDTLEALERKQLVQRITQSPHHQREPLPLLREPHLQANAEQQAALQAIAAGKGFTAWLLQGITGSGKTEVYLQSIEHCLRDGRQALILVPEIGLTPQTVERFRRRFNVPLAVLHSGLNDRERLDAWLAAREGEAALVIGTRSAIFTPLARPGLLIVDEEHDLSYKQQEGLRYNARDLAVYRAHLEQIPVILGSATPSLESLHNVERGRYQLLRLNERAGNAKPPQFQCIDIRSQPLQDGLSQPLLQAIGSHLKRGNQVLVFINRRGFAPTLMCHDCGWIADCRRCDARMTLHQQPAHLHCHHCDSQRPIDRQCPKCQSGDLRPVGTGTERAEDCLQQQFPGYPVLRIDRDSTARKDAMQQLLARVHSGAPCLLVGTQMLAKGHHFPDVTLVAILDADGGLFSADFRGPERMAQMITQVAGRAGRADKPGQVLIQTHMAEHPLLQDLCGPGYPAIAASELALRHSAGLPPCRYAALLRAEANLAQTAEDFLQLAADLALKYQLPVEILGPVPAAMERRAGRYRAQLLLLAEQRATLHSLLTPWLQQLELLPAARKVRWSIDVDPLDMF